MADFDIERVADAPRCDPALPNAASTYPHDYEVRERLDARGGLLVCVACGRTAYTETAPT